MKTNVADRELLELAAKAAGVDLQYADDEGFLTYDGNTCVDWTPLTSDGDAFRLAVKLRLVVHIWQDGSSASVAKSLADGEDPPDDSNAWCSGDAHACGDISAATRRAIVRAAAEIGKESHEEAGN